MLCPRQLEGLLLCIGISSAVGFREGGAGWDGKELFWC